MEVLIRTDGPKECLMVALWAISCCLIACKSGTPPPKQEVKVQALVIFSNGSESKIGSHLSLGEQCIGDHISPSPHHDTLCVFRNFGGVSPESLHLFGERNIQPGKAYLVTSNGLKFFKDVDLKLTDQQLATQLGVE